MAIGHDREGIPEMNARPNIVLIHGAWADGSCWSGVIERLQAGGYHVTAPQFPLTALADDVARLRQVLDIQAENRDIDLVTLQNIHKHKTGMLIRAAVRMGALVGDASADQLNRLTGYAEDVGLAFQIADDVLNVTGTREELGKNANTDAQRGKKTYPTFYGVEGARALADECTERAVGRLSQFSETADPLRELARYITARKN